WNAACGDKKQTALEKRTAFRRKAFCPLDGSHFLFNNKTSIRESDRSGNPATQHGWNEETVIYEKIEMLRCRLKHCISTHREKY
ncbi:hypothetical protein, partial [Leptospira borgpetersenii]|uniref:hypothetical protein n=1 Tax=Leptospira borgpetersenii TaxID=174 RepID=UPI001E57FEB2